MIIDEKSVQLIISSEYVGLVQFVYDIINTPSQKMTKCPTSMSVVAGIENNRLNCHSTRPRGAPCYWNLALN